MKAGKRITPTEKGLVPILRGRERFNSGGWEKKGSPTAGGANLQSHQKRGVGVTNLKRTTTSLAAAQKRKKSLATDLINGDGGYTLMGGVRWAPKESLLA